MVVTTVACGGQQMSATGVSRQVETKAPVRRILMTHEFAKVAARRYTRSFKRMDSLVMELQRECLGPGVSVADLLRKALVVARKLGVRDLQSWIENELNGHDATIKVPPYRITSGELKAWDAYRGTWIPYIVRDPKSAELISKCEMRQSASELEDFARETVGGRAGIVVPFSPYQLQILNPDDGYTPSRHLGRTAIVGIIDTIRNTILQWTLKLEEDGIVGEGMTFTPTEKATAAQAHYTINYNAPVGTSQIQQGSPGASQTVSTVDLTALREVLAELKGRIAEVKLCAQDADQLQADVQGIETQLAAPQQNHVVIRELMASITNILERCAGSILAAGILHKLTGM